MNSKFAVTGGSVIGRNHALMGKNNQDAYKYLSNNQLTLAVVCGGCGSCPHSEVGAKLWIKAILNYFQTHPNQAINEKVIKDYILQELKKLS